MAVCPMTAWLPTRGQAPRAQGNPRQSPLVGIVQAKHHPQVRIEDRRQYEGIVQGIDRITLQRRLQRFL